MNLVWAKKTKYLVVAISAFIGISSLGLATLQLTTRKQEVVENVLYSYESKEDIDYNVKVNSTQFYDQTILPKDQYYISKYVESITFDYINETKISKALPLRGHYQIVAELRGYSQEMQGEEEKKIPIWSKTKVLKEKVVFDKIVDHYPIHETIHIALNSYTAWINYMKKIENLRMPIELSVRIEGSKIIKGDKGEITLPIFTEAIIPIGEDYFKIESKPSTSVHRECLDTIQVEVTPHYKSIVREVVISFIMLVIGIMVSFLVKVEDKSDNKVNRELKKLYRDYGSQIIAIQAINLKEFKHIYKVENFKNLVKLSDELKRPILKIRREEKSIMFCIIENQDIYIYELIEDGNEENLN